MITASKLSAWRNLRTHGSIADRVTEERDGISCQDWTTLEELVSRVRADFQGLTSASFAAQTDELLRESTESALVAQEIRRIALSGERVFGERVSRSASIVAAWGIVVTSLVVGITRHLPQIVVTLSFFAGFVPYIVSIQYIEPWLHRRATEMSKPAPFNSG